MAPRPTNTSGMPSNGASDQRSRAAVQRAKATDQKLNKAAASAALALVILARRAPDTAVAVIHATTGIALKRPGWAKFTRFAYTWLAPQPFGIIPPGVYGLSPGYLHGAVPGLPESEYLHTMGPDHPAMIAFQKKKDLRAKLQPIGPTITGGAGAEGFTYLAKSGILEELANAPRWPGELKHYLSHKIFGAAEQGIRGALQKSNTVSDTLESAAQVPGQAPAVLAPAAPAIRERAAAEKLRETTAASAASTLTRDVFRAGKRRHVETVAPSRALLHRRRSETLQALDQGNRPASKVGR